MDSSSRRTGFHAFLFQWTVLVATLHMLAGCATPQLTERLLAQPPVDLPPQVELSDVPFFPQELYQCGPAALAEVLQYRGIEATPEALKGEVYLPERQGSLQVELIAAARSRGMVVYPLEPSLEDLLAELAAGNPVLVLQNLSLPIYPLWHYAVVIGYDLSRETLLLRSGTTARQETPLATFERTWARGDHWAILILPPDQLPETADHLKYLTVVQELEAVGRVPQARAAFETALKKWPRSEIAWFGLGNTAYALDEFSQAEAAFRALLEITPLNVPAWNNLAYTLVAQGCDREAEQAAQCALALAPTDENVVATVVDVMKLAGQQTSTARCAPLHCPKPAP